MCRTPGHPRDISVCPEQWNILMQGLFDYISNQWSVAEIIKSPSEAEGKNQPEWALAHVKS